MSIVDHIKQVAEVIHQSLLPTIPIPTEKGIYKVTSFNGQEILSIFPRHQQINRENFEGEIFYTCEGENYTILWLDHNLVRLSRPSRIGGKLIMWMVYVE